MWVLTNKTNPEKVYYILLSKKEHTVGRKDCNLHLPGDMSVSRQHAFLFPETDRIRLIDNDSKYGTYVNDNIEAKVGIPHKIPYEVRDGSRIRFGVLENEFTVKKLTIVVVTSTLDLLSRNALQARLQAIQCTVVTEWQNDCTHLTMKEVVVTTKVLLALISQVAIVTPSYWQAFVNSVSTNESLPDAKEFLPVLVDKFLGVDVTLHPNPNRMKIFKNLQFVFMQSKQMAKYKSVIELAGGQCSSLDSTPIPKSSFIKPNTVVIQSAPTESCSQTRSSVTASVIGYLDKHNKRVVPEREIGMAILTCSTTRNCNPQHRPQFLQTNSSTAPSTELSVLVHGTPSVVNNSFTCSTENVIVVPETVSNSMECEVIETNRNQTSESQNSNVNSAILSKSTVNSNIQAAKKTAPMSAVYEDLDVIECEESEVIESEPSLTSRETISKRKQPDSQVSQVRAKRTCGSSLALLEEIPKQTTKETEESEDSNEVVTTRVSARTKAKVTVAVPIARKSVTRATAAAAAAANAEVSAKVTPRKKNLIETVEESSQIEKPTDDVPKTQNIETKRPLSNTSKEVGLDLDFEDEPARKTRRRIARLPLNAAELPTAGKFPEPFQSRDLNVPESGKRQRHEAASDSSPTNNMFDFDDDNEGPSKRRRALRQKLAAAALMPPPAVDTTDNAPAAVTDISFISRIKITDDGWISMSQRSNKKEDNFEPDKGSDDDHGWVESIRDGFEVKTLKVNLSARSFVNHSEVGNVANGNPGFKAFKKKHVYNATRFGHKLVPTPIN